MTKDWEFDAISSAFAPMSLSVACRNASLRATIGPGPSEGSACRFSLPAWQSWASARQAAPMPSRQRAASARCRACSLTTSRCTSPATSSPGSSRTHNNPPRASNTAPLTQQRTQGGPAVPAGSPYLFVTSPYAPKVSKGTTTTPSDLIRAIPPTPTMTALTAGGFSPRSVILRSSARRLEAAWSSCM